MSSNQSAKAVFKWEDPLLLDDQLTEDERMVREAARAYCQDKLLPLIVDCCRVGLAASDAMSSRVCNAVLVLHDPQASLSVNRALLMEFFGLSRAEAKVASLLAEGESPLDIGLILGVSTNTVRTHLRMIASKLGVSRQAEVVRMLMLLPAELD